MAQLHLIIDEGDRDTLLWALDLATRNAQWFLEAMHSTDLERELGALREASLTRLRSAVESAETSDRMPREVAVLAKFLGAKIEGEVESFADERARLKEQRLQAKLGPRPPYGGPGCPDPEPCT